MTSKEVSSGNAEQDILVIGAGFAGLAAGCYAAMNDFKVTVLEMHTLPGGLCTSWQRQGYTFDYCIHWLVGSSPAHDFHRIWKELGVVQGRRFLDHEIFFRLEHPDGRAVNLYADADKLEGHLTSLFPADASEIRKMCRIIRTCSRLQLMEFSLHPRDLLKMLRSFSAMAHMRRLGHLTCEEYAKRFKDPLLRSLIGEFFGIEDMPIMGLLFTLGWMHARSAGYPIGGSLPMSQAIERRLLSLGGKVCYRKKVEEILIRDGKAVGVRLEDGSELFARHVISAADAYATFKRFLRDQHPIPLYEKYFKSSRIFSGIVQISLGVNRDLSDLPQSVTWSLKSPLRVDTTTTTRMSIHHHAYDKTMAPPGKSVLLVRLNADYAFWKNLANTDRTAYKAEKERILSEVLSALEARLPGISSQVEVSDVATPHTNERYTGNWQGSIEGWLLTPEVLQARMKGETLPKTVPQVSNLYLAGQWTEPGGGLPPSAQSGRNVIKLICKAEGRAFRTSIPSERELSGVEPAVLWSPR